jgi:hypothetical protein
MLEVAICRLKSFQIQQKIVRTKEAIVASIPVTSLAKKHRRLTLLKQQSCLGLTRNVEHHRIRLVVDVADTVGIIR